MAALCLSPFVSISSSTSFFTRLFHQNPLFVSSLLPLRQSKRKISDIRPISISFALAESDSAKSLDQEDAAPLLQELADSFRLPLDYFEKLPRDLRLDLNDAAFDLANGPVLDEKGPAEKCDHLYSVYSLNLIRDHLVSVPVHRLLS